MNVILTSATLLGLLLFGTLSTWQHYQKGKTQIEHGVVATQEVQSFLLPLYSTLSKSESCSSVLAPIVLPSPMPVAPGEVALGTVSLNLAGQTVTTNTALGPSTLKALNGFFEFCGSTCGTPLHTHKLRLEWELEHATSKRMQKGRVSNITFNPSSTAPSIADCKMSGATGAATSAPFDCSVVNATLSPSGDCATQNQVLTANGISPSPSGGIQLQMTKALMSDLITPPTGGPPQTCGANQAATGLNLGPSGTVQLNCAIATPTPSSTPSSTPTATPSPPSCLPRPPSCLSCWTSSMPMGQVCYSAMWQAGSLMRYFWVPNATSGAMTCCAGIVGAGSCTFLASYMCHSTVSGGPYPCPVHRCR